MADEEARHYGWCHQRLGELGHHYGEMEAHDLLWQGAEASSGDLCGRLAIVPLTQEARGLDAGGSSPAPLCMSYPLLTHSRLLLRLATPLQAPASRVDSRAWEIS